MFEKRTYLNTHLLELLEHEKFQQYYHILKEANQTTNLTRIIEENDVYYKHFYDSIVLHQWFDLKGKTLLDVGSGAGFPSLPLKIIEPSLQVVIVDSLQKRIRFLEDLTTQLGLDHVTLIHGRAEELPDINHYDYVTSRAVARLNILVELTLPFVKVGGYFIAYKSLQYKEELDEAMNGIKELGGSLEDVKEYPVSDQESHVLIIIKKVKNTKNQYPRIFGKIKKHPL